MKNLYESIFDDEDKIISDGAKELRIQNWIDHAKSGPGYIFSAGNWLGGIDPKNITITKDFEINVTDFIRFRHLCSMSPLPDYIKFNEVDTMGVVGCQDLPPMNGWPRFVKGILIFENCYFTGEPLKDLPTEHVGHLYISDEFNQLKTSKYLPDCNSMCLRHTHKLKGFKNGFPKSCKDFTWSCGGSGIKDLSGIPVLDRLTLEHINIDRLEDLPRVKDELVLKYVTITDKFRDRRWINLMDEQAVKKITKAKSVIITC